MTPRKIASLPMYPAAGRQAHLRLWQELARRLIQQGMPDVPQALECDPADLMTHWQDERLLLSQACGYPYATQLRAAKVQLVGAFRYKVPGCVGIRYRSLLLCRQEDAGCSLADFRGRIAAVNSTDSHSGWNALRAEVAAHGKAAAAGCTPFFSTVVLSGSHADSVRQVREGEADIASIDCVSHAVFARHTPTVLRGTRVLAGTRSAPGLPLITSALTPPADLAALRIALRHAVELSDIGSALLIDGFETVPDSTYEEILDIERDGLAQGAVCS